MPNDTGFSRFPSLSATAGKPETIFPLAVWEKLQEFVLDKRTGNISINVKDGKVLGVRVEELLSVK